MKSISKESINLLLQNNPKQDTLNVSQNEIERIENLDEMIFLQFLDLSKNRINRISNLEKIGNIKILDLSFNQIEKIQNLKSLTKLQEFDISNNLIRNFQGLEEIQFNFNLKKIMIENNPIYRDEVDIERKLIILIPNIRTINKKPQASFVNTAQKQLNFDPFEKNLSNESSIDLLQTQIESFQNIIKILQSQLKDSHAEKNKNSNSDFPLNAWREKCFQLMVQCKSQQKEYKQILSQNKKLVTQQQNSQFLKQDEKQKLLQEIDLTRTEVQQKEMMLGSMQRQLNEEIKKVKFSAESSHQFIQQQMNEQINEMQIILKEKINQETQKLSQLENLFEATVQHLSSFKTNNQIYNNEVTSSLQSLLRLYGDKEIQESEILLSDLPRNADIKAQSENNLKLIAFIQQTIVKLIEQKQQINRQKRQDALKLGNREQEFEIQRRNIAREQSEQIQQLQMVLQAKEEKIIELEEDLNIRQTRIESLRKLTSEKEQRIEQLEENLQKLEEKNSLALQKLKEDYEIKMNEKNVASDNALYQTQKILEAKINEISQSYQYQIDEIQQEQNKIAIAYHEQTMAVEQCNNKLEMVENEQKFQAYQKQEQLLEEQNQKQKLSNQVTDLLRVLESKDKQIQQMKIENSRQDISNPNINHNEELKFNQILATQNDYKHDIYDKPVGGDQYSFSNNKNEHKNKVNTSIGNDNRGKLEPKKRNFNNNYGNNNESFEKQNNDWSTLINDWDRESVQPPSKNPNLDYNFSNTQNYHDENRSQQKYITPNQDYSLKDQKPSEPQYNKPSDYSQQYSDNQNKFGNQIQETLKRTEDLEKVALSYLDDI